MVVKKKERKGLSREESVVAECLKEGEIIHLALKDDDGLFCVPVNYGFGGGKIYIHSSKRGRKIAALREGGEIGFNVLVSHKVVEHENPCEWGCDMKSVMGTGVPRILEEKEKKEALTILMGQYSDREWEFKPSAMEAVDVVEIMITSASARVVKKD